MAVTRWTSSESGFTREAQQAASRDVANYVSTLGIAPSRSVLCPGEVRNAASRLPFFEDAASCASTASPLPNRSRRKRSRSEGLSSSRQTEVCRSPIGRRRMRNYFPSQRSELRLDLRRSKLRLDIALPSPLLMRRSACCEFLPQTLRPAEYPRRRALPGPVRRVRSSSLMTAPASGPADESSGLLQLFSPPLHLHRPALETLQAAPLRLRGPVGPIRPACPVVTNRTCLRHSRPLAQTVDLLSLAGLNTWRFPVSPFGLSGTRRRRAWQHLCCLEHDA